MERRKSRCAEDELQEQCSSRIPRLRRSASLRMRGERASGPGGRLCPSISEVPLASSATATPVRPPPPAPRDQHEEDLDGGDLDSERSFGSVYSAMSCDHACFARNGTTFSGRRMRYVVHCASHAGQTEEYLTPTQRATRQIRRLKALLKQAQTDLEDKNNDIFRLTKEVLELRLYKASSLGNPPDPEEEGQQPPRDDLDKPCSDLPSSLADSGHFEDMACLSGGSPLYHHHHPSSSSPLLEDREGERGRIVDMFEKRIEEMIRRHVEEQQEMKEKHNDKVDSLLNRLSDSSDRYSDLRIEYDTAQDRIRELEKEVESLRKSVTEQEDRHQSMYLKMYVKGQEAARFEHADQVLEFAHRAPTRVSVPELLQQLQVTENELENIKAMYRRIVESRAGQSKIDPEITLQFLKSAVYYFFTDRENQQGHLNAIQSILGYTDNEKHNIEKAYRTHK